MIDIAKLDKNFKVQTKIEKDDIRFYDVKEVPFDVRGLVYDSDKFRRIPASEAEKISSGVSALSTHAAGGRVRFKTNSEYVAIHAIYGSTGKMPHFAFTGSVGFDMYEFIDGEYVFRKTFTPPIDISDSYESVHDFLSVKERELVIDFPLYSQVKELYIGLSEKAEISAPTPYRDIKPFVYYGSSITQGGCASRPGNSYESIISRRFNIDYLNLGFSGNAKGEEKMAEYVSRLDMSVFVYDYDYNAPTEEHLEKTHERMFSIIREKNPTLPIIIMPSPHCVTPVGEVKRHEIVKRTYDNAKAKGDENVYYISGEELMAAAGHDGTVDDCHPNDYGFYSMAKAIGDCIETILLK